MDLYIICNCSGIYCIGPILHRVQTAKLFDDDKYFVDMSLRQPPRKLVSFPPPEPPTCVLSCVSLQTSFSRHFPTCRQPTPPPSCRGSWTPTLTSRGQSSSCGLHWTGMKSETACWRTAGPSVRHNLTAFIPPIRPKFLAGISDKEFCAWAEAMHKTWKSLSRKVMKVQLFDEIST